MAGRVENLFRHGGCLKRSCGFSTPVAMAHATTKLSELQNGTSALPDLVPR